MSLVFNKYKLLSVISIALLFIFLQFAYVKFVYEYFSYMNYIYEYNFIKLVLVNLVFFAILFFLFFVRSSSFMFFINTIFIILLIIPNLILYQFNPDFDFFIVFSVVFFITLMLILSGIRIKHNLKIKKFTTKQIVIILVALIFVMILPFIFVFKFNLNFSVFKMIDIYEFRQESSSQISTIMSYFNSWLSKILLPLAIVYGIKNKNWFVVSVSVAVLLYIFLILAQKLVFFSVIIVLFLSVFKSGHKQSFAFAFTFLVIAVISQLITIFSGNILLESLIVRRALFVPAQLNQYYFDFFDGRPIYLSHSFLSYFTEYPYDYEPQKMIAINYFNSFDMWANNGFISDGFMNFGKFGAILFSIFVALLFKFFDNLKISYRFAGLFFIIIFTLISSYFFTSLLTHGIILLMIISFFILRKTENEN